MMELKSSNNLDMKILEIDYHELQGRPGFKHDLDMC